MMSTMAVMGASFGKSDWTGWRCFYSKPSRQKRLPCKVALNVTPGGELSNNAATETSMSSKPRKSSKKSSNPALNSTGLQLGRAVEWPTSPEEAKLDRVPNPQKDTNYVVRFTAPEFTSLCPVTGQPDFAHLMIDYVPGQWLLESKSLKLYVASFRNHGAFHEDCTVAIGKRIAAEIKPKWLRIGGYWYPRGGIPIDVFWQTGKLPKGMWIPEQGVAPYRGRG
jgi:7-cyano-7-deazaguanine reductase